MISCLKRICLKKIGDLQVFVGWDWDQSPSLKFTQRPKLSRHTRSSFLIRPFLLPREVFILRAVHRLLEKILIPSFYKVCYHYNFSIWYWVYSDGWCDNDIFSSFYYKDSSWRYRWKRQDASKNILGFTQ